MKNHTENTNLFSFGHPQTPQKGRSLGAQISGFDRSFLGGGPRPHEKTPIPSMGGVPRPPPALFLYPRNPKQPLRLFTESELRQRLGTLDADCVAKEIAMSTEELDEHMEASGSEKPHPPTTSPSFPFLLFCFFRGPLCFPPTRQNISFFAGP